MMRLHNAFLSLFLLGVSLCFFSPSVRALQPVNTGDAFFIEIYGHEQVGLRIVDEKGMLFLKDDLAIDVSGKDNISVKNDIHAQLASSYMIKNIVYYNKNDLVRVTVLGDVSRPGNYQIPVNTSLDQINGYTGLYDQKLFDSAITVVRRGKRHVIGSDEELRMQVQPDDILLLSLEKKPEALTNEKQPPLKQVVKEEQKSDSLNLVNKVDAGKSKEELPSDQIAETSSEEPVETVDEHILQPGDILTINLPGEDGFNKDFIVDRAGAIQLPEIGLVDVAGKPMSAVKTLVYLRLSDVFLGLDKLSVHLKEKRILISILGFVETPGEVELPADATIQAAINAAGGLIDGAQLDKLQLQRNGDVREFNFKRYLNTGNADLVPKLQTLDVIFVPSSPELGNIHGQSLESGDGMDPTDDRTAIKVFGEVISPSSFPYVEGMNLVDALLKAGGVTRYSNVEQIRVIDQGEPVLFNLKSFLDGGDESKLLKLSEGATIFVPKQVEAVQGGGRVVYVMGQVQKPGSFETGDNVGFLDVLANAGGPNRYADTRMVRILRANGEVLPFNLQAYAEGKKVSLPEIIAGDAIFIPMKSPDDDQSWVKIKTEKSIKLIGAIRKPGRYEWSEDITFLDLVGYAGGPTKEADLAHIRILMPDPEGNVVTTQFNMQEFFERGGNWSEIPKLAGGSTIIFPELPRSPTDNNAQWIMLPKEQAIYMMGAVVGPGRFAFNDKMGFLDILSAADGPTKDADLSKVRIVHRNEGVPKVSMLDLLEYFETGDEALLPKVKPGDSIFIPTKEKVVDGGGRIVYVMGQVQKPGSFEMGEEVGLLDILANAGGPNRYADTRMLRILRANGEVLPFNLQAYAEGKKVTLPEILPGDAIFIPMMGKDDDQSWTKVKTDKSIKLMGAVTKPGRFEWNEGITFLDLVGYAGGPTKEADLSHVRILRPDSNGKVITTEFNMQEFLERGGNWSEIPELVGGSTIVFPELPRSPIDNNAQWVRLPKEQAIYMMGAVNGPGRFAFNEKMGLLDILSAADGPSKDADLSKVRIVHRNEDSPRVSIIDLNEYFETGDETLLPTVKPGDSIFIPSIERTWVDRKKEDTVRILGAVKLNGRYDFVNEMTILDLLAEAGGPTSAAYLKKIIIVNISCCVNQAYTFDLEGFMRNPAASKLPVLRSGDTVYIPDISKSYWAMFMSAVKDAVSALSLFAIINGL